MEDKHGVVKYGVYFTSVIVKFICIIAVVIGTFFMIAAVGVAFYTESVAPETHTLSITDKTFEGRSTRFSYHLVPVLHFTLDSEEIKVTVNGESYNNVSIGDFVAVDVWKIKGVTVRTDLNTELNNIKERGQ